MRYHKQGSSILEQQGELSPWLGEVQMHREEDEPRDMHTHFVGSPYQYLEVLPEEDEGEGEMFEGEMWDKAVKENVQLSTKLKWDKYIYQISGLLTGRNMAGLPARVLRAGDPEFAQFLSKWQEKNKKDPLRVTVLGTDGILGLNTWTVMQWYLGLHKLNNKHLNLSAVKKAISHNTKIIKRLSEEKSEGKSKLDFVFDYFDYEKIAKGPLNHEYTAYAIAEFQNKNKKTPNGILDDSTWRDLELAIRNIFKGDYEVRFNIGPNVTEHLVRENLRLSEELRWKDHMYNISMLVGGSNGTLMPAPIRLYTPGDRDFAVKVFEWQDNYNKKYKGQHRQKLVVDGILGLNAWTMMQEAMGFFNFDVNNIRSKIKNIEDVKKINRKHKINYKDIVKELAKRDVITNGDLQFNEEYLAYCIAAYQEKNRLGIDGMIGPKTWQYLMAGDLGSPGLSANRDIRFTELKKWGVMELAPMFKFAVEDLEQEVDNQARQLERHLIDAKVIPDSNFWKKLGIDIGVLIINVIAAYFTAGTSAAASGAAASGKAGGGAAVGGAAGILGSFFKDYLDDGAKEAADKRNKSIQQNVNDATRVKYLNLDLYQIQEFFKKKIISAGGNNDEIVNLILDIEELSANENLVKKLLLINTFNYFKTQPRLIVGYNNQIPIEYWSLNDISNIKTKWGELRIEFCQNYMSLGSVNGIPQTPMRITGDNIKILKEVWQYWSEFYQLHELDLKLSNIELLNLMLPKTDKRYEPPGYVSVYFKANHSDGVTYLSSHSDKSTVYNSPMTIMKAPFELHVANIKIGSPQWGNKFTYTDEMIFVNNKNNYIKRKYIEKNSKGVSFDKIVKDIVSFVLDNKYNASGSERKIIFWEGETHQNPEITYDAWEAEPQYEMDMPNNDFTEWDDNEMPPDSNSNILNVPDNHKKTAGNRAQVERSGIAVSDILQVVGSLVNLSALRRQMERHNLQNPNDVYQINASNPATIDAVFTEAIHQFQRAHYFDPKEQDGILNASTLDTLGFKEHKLRPRLNSTDWHGQNKLDDIKSRVSKSTNGEFTSGNWFRCIVRPAFLGHKIKQGVHLLLWRKLQEAQTWLLAQPQYKGMTPVQLGRTLGLDRPDVEYSGARLSKDNQAMHSFGLAIDIDRQRHSWIGAGWVQYDKEKLKERHRMLETLRKASGERLPGSNIFEYLHSIAQSAGADTRAAYSVLKKRHDEFIAYLQNNPAELRYWKNSATFGSRDPLLGFLSLHPDLVYALREVAGLAWGAIDFGPRACGDIMHFDTRMSGVGQIIAHHIGGFVPSGGHPALSVPSSNEIWYENEFEDADEYQTDYEYHEAIGEAEWEDSYSNEEEDDFNQ